MTYIYTLGNKRREDRALKHEIKKPIKAYWHLQMMLKERKPTIKRRFVLCVNK